MERNAKHPPRPLHPGRVLGEELVERGISQRAFANMIGVSHTNLNEFVNGKRNLNEDWAFKFEDALGISFTTWMNLQNNYCYYLHQKDIQQQETKKHSEMVTTSFTLRRETRARVAQMAETAGMSVSAFIRQTMEKMASGALTL